MYKWTKSTYLEDTYSLESKSGRLIATLMYTSSGWMCNFYNYECGNAFFVDWQEKEIGKKDVKRAKEVSVEKIRKIILETVGKLNGLLDELPE